jgi:hypothetical protein
MLEEVVAITERAGPSARAVFRQARTCLAHSHSLHTELRRLHRRHRALAEATHRGFGAATEVEGVEGAKEAGTTAPRQPSVWELLSADVDTEDQAEAAVQGMEQMLEALAAVEGKASEYTAAVQQMQQEEGIVVRPSWECALPSRRARRGSCL